MRVQIFDGTTPYGWITTVHAGAKQTTPLDRVGSFSFTCSASDPNIAQLVAGRTVFGYEKGKLRLSGIIEEIGDATADGVPSKAISGPDLTKELSQAHIASQSLSEAGWARVVSVFDLKIDFGNSTEQGGIALEGPNDQPSAYDSDPATYSEESVGGVDWWRVYIGAAEPFTKLRFVCGPGNGVVGAFGGQYFDGYEWKAITVTSDGTAVGGNTFQQNGDIEFTLEPGDSMEQTTEQGRAAYFVRCYIGITSDAARIYDCHAWGHVPTATALALIAAQFPTTGNGYAHTWELDTTTGLSATVKTDVYDTLSRVSVLEALIKLGELTGEHWYAYFDAATQKGKIVWIGNTNAVAAGASSTSTGTVDVQVSASGDDGYCYKNSAGWFDDDNAMQIGMGYNDDHVELGWIRFASVPIPQGATITAARMQWQASADETDNPVVAISAEDADDAAAPTDATDRRGKTPTTASVDYALEDYVQDTWYNTPSLVNVVQEIVNRPGWVSGNAIQFLISGDTASKAVNVFRSIYTWDQTGHTSGPRLHVEFTITNPAAPLHIYVPPVPSLVEDNTSVALLSRLKVTTNCRDTVTRVYPVGAGLGDGSLTLAYATMTMPAGFVINKTENYIRLDPEGTRKDGKFDAKDVGPVTSDLRARENASNALAAATLVHLGRNSAANVSYEVECINLTAGIVKPGMKVWVTHRQWVDGQLVFSVDDDDLIVLEITDTITLSATVTTGLKVSTLAAWPITDDEYLRRMLRNQRAMSATAQPLGIADVRTPDFDVDPRPFGTGAGGLARTTSSPSSGGGGGGMAPHDIVGGYHTATGLTTGNFLRAESATSFTFAPIGAADLPDHDVVSAHSASGLTPGDVLTATGPTAFSFQTPSPPSLADHDHSGDAGDGGTFDAANLTSGAATDGQVLTADGAGGAAWEDPAAGGAHDILSATHSDTDTTAPSDADVLTWDAVAGKWKAAAPAGGPGGGADPALAAMNLLGWA